MSKVVLKRVATLEGSHLDYAVALALGDQAEVEYRSRGQTVFGRPYSSEWYSCGPIIEREKISINYEGCEEWEALAYTKGIEVVEGCGHTPLIAAMRAFVRAKLGDEVEVPV